MEAWSRRMFLGTLGATAAQFTLGMTSAASKRRPPNVILMLTDDQGSVDVGCYGATDLHTPHMDSLAERGVRFTQFYVASTICSPSRGALLTGRYPQRNGLATNAGAGGETGLPVDEVLLSELFKEQGYRTGIFGKWHLGMPEEMGPIRRGFDEFFGHKVGCIDNYSHFFYWSGPNRHDLWRDEEYVRADGEFFPDLMTREACRFLDENQDNPFFLYLPYNLPHYPMQAEEPFVDLYGDDIDEPRRRYAAFLSNLDDHIGQVMAKVDDLGLRDNTIVLFLSDNGHSVEERAFYGGGSAGPYRGHKFTFWEGGIRMPCIVSWPGVIPEGEVRDQTTIAMDWLPTIAAYCGLHLPDRTLDGHDIRAIINDAQAASPHEVLHWMVHRHWAVLKGDWKLVCNVPDTPLADTTIRGEELFLANLREDPGETHNLAEAHPEIVAELTRLHHAWLEDTQRR